MGDPAGRADLSFDAVLFDLDGVVTRTAELHAAAWKELFDELLRARAAEGHAAFAPFDVETDYLAYVDGKPRAEGVRSFLASRGIQLPEGEPTDTSPSTIQGLSARKDARFKQRLRNDSVGVFASTLSLIRALRAEGVKTAVVTSSRNGREVLRAAGVEDLFDARVDGIDAEVLGLPGKPNPAPFLRAADLLGVMPGRALVVEDAVSGVEAARRGGFGLVIGLDHGENRDALAAHGADVVVADLAELDMPSLDARVRERREAVLAWRVEQDGFDPTREPEMESLFTVGNGYLGVRGAVESPLPGSHADLFIAGVYDGKHEARRYSEVEFLGGGRGDETHRELVSVPFPFRLGITVDGVSLDVPARSRAQRRILDLREATLYGYTEYETELDRRVFVHTRRFASLSDPHLLLQEVTVYLANFSGTVELDASLADPNLSTHHPHLTPLAGAERHDGIEIQRFKTQASGVEIALAARTMLAGSDRTSAPRWRVTCLIGAMVTLRRYVAVFTSNDAADPVAAAADRVDRLQWQSFDEVLDAHRTRWASVWARANVRIRGSPKTEQALRFNAYHLTIAVDRNPRVSVGARALTGRAYEGHVFWDVEMFKFPFYLFTYPEVARCLLLYRHNTLEGARRRARALGYDGACYAWESTVSGDDVTPSSIRLKTTGREIPIFNGAQQVHVTADVAYAVWRYCEATRDTDFMYDAGVEILVETARFWASRCTRGPKCLHIRDVVGPDEYHHSVNDNAYTNWIAKFNLEKAVEATAWMQRRASRRWSALAERLGVASEERRAWKAAARDLYCPGPNAQGVIEQFEGFFDLEDYDLPSEQRFNVPISRLFDWERINRLKLVKQADVLMLLHVFSEAFSRDVVAANFRYYEPLTDHGSSLSPGIHAAVAARLGFRDELERYWRQSLWLDLSNRTGTSALGVHPACMGATWQAMVFGVLGIRFDESGLKVAEDAALRLPKDWLGAALTLVWRGRPHDIEVARLESP